MFSVSGGILLTLSSIGVLTVNGGGNHFCESVNKNFCQNGATCNAFNGGNNYNCSCTEGFKGRNCHLIDCSYSYCKNGGTCTTSNGGTGYKCSCTDGWIGSNCDLVDCSYSHCKNGGTCTTTNGGAGYKCSCTDGWKGSSCDLVDCSHSYCKNGGTCTTTTGGAGYKCSCTDGWKGSNCDLIDCSYSHCKNGGTCTTTNRGAGYKCSCTDGWKGSSCDLVDCSYSYCKNGGTCTTSNGGTGYKCSCTDGWIGSICDLVDCNSVVHCGKYGDCQRINGGKDKKCNCYHGWIGERCNIIDVCTPWKKADIVFVLDTSLSQGHGTFDRQKQYVKNFISKYQIGSPNYRYQFSVVTFSLQATVHFYFNTYSTDKDLENAIDLITVVCDGPSLTGNALKMVRKNVFQTINGARGQKEVEHYVILLTDGLSSDPRDAVLEANLLKAKNVQIFTVGSGLSVRHGELLEISSFKDYVFAMATDDSLQALLKYTMFGCDKVGTNGTQFSYSTFTDKVINVYNFTAYNTRADLIADVSKTTRQAFSTTADVTNALSELNKNGFSASKGSRTYARKVVVVVTSGNVNDMQQLLKETKRLNDSGKIIVTIGSGMNANYANLLEIASDPALAFIVGNDVHIDVRALDSLKSLLVSNYCSHV